MSFTGIEQIILWVDDTGLKNETFDAYNLYYEEIDPTLTQIKEEITKAKSVIFWLRTINEFTYRSDIHI